jgi:hypothetical protein
LQFTVSHAQATKRRAQAAAAAAASAAKDAADVGRHSGGGSTSILVGGRDMFQGQHVDEDDDILLDERETAQPAPTPLELNDILKRPNARK